MSQPSAWLILDSDNSIRIELSDLKVVLGRESKYCTDFSIPVMSRVHCSVEKIGQDWVICDEKSLNGTWINQIRVNRQILRNGDRISFGKDSSDALIFQSSRKTVVVGDNDADIRSRIMKSVDVSGLFSAERTSIPRVNLETIKPYSAIPDTDAATADTSDPVAASVSTENASVIRLFSEMGESLLTSDNLHTMLEKVIDLAFVYLPAQRGSISLYDEATDSLLPQVTRQGRLKAPIRISRSIVDHVIKAKSSILVTDTGSDVRFADKASIVEMNIRSAMCAPMYHKGRVLGIVYIDMQSEGSSFNEQDLMILTSLSVFAAVGVEQARLRDDIEREKLIRTRLARYSSPSVIEQIVSAGEVIFPEEKEVTVLFADLQGFTSLSESMAPAAVARILNCVFERFTEIIFGLEGTLDKFIGDAVMAIFGAPLKQVDHASRAIQAGLMMKQALREMTHNSSILPPLKMRIGINSGLAVVGDIGSPDRKDYTAIGDTVNVASRLESSVAEPDQIVIGSATHDLVFGKFEVEKLETARLKGKHKDVQPYLVIRAIN